MENLIDTTINMKQDDGIVKVISVSDSGDIINQYIIFSQVLDEQVKMLGRTK